MVGEFEAPDSPRDYLIDLVIIDLDRMAPRTCENSSAIDYESSWSREQASSKPFALIFFRASFGSPSLRRLSG